MPHSPLAQSAFVLQAAAAAHEDQPTLLGTTPSHTQTPPLQSASVEQG